MVVLCRAGGRDVESWTVKTRDGLVSWRGRSNAKVGLRQVVRRQETHGESRIVPLLNCSCPAAGVLIRRSTWQTPTPGKTRSLRSPTIAQRTASVLHLTGGRCPRRLLAVGPTSPSAPTWGQSRTAGCASPEVVQGRMEIAWVNAPAPAVEWQFPSSRRPGRVHVFRRVSMSMGSIRSGDSHPKWRCPHYDGTSSVDRDVSRGIVW